jgi:ribosome-associated protein
MNHDERLIKAVKIAQAACDLKAEDLVALDARGVASFADTFILVTGSSDRHVRSITDAIEQALSALGEKPLGIEGYKEARWVLMDLSDVIVHIFQAEVRAYYDLERLWSEAPALDLLGRPAPDEITGRSLIADPSRS